MGKSILNILEDFEFDLKLIENHIEVIQTRYKKKTGTIIDKIDLLSDRAKIEFFKKENVENKIFDEKTSSLIIDITDKVIENDSIARKIYNSFTVKFNDENNSEISVLTNAPGLIDILHKQESNTDKDDEIFGYKTVLYNLCSSIEHVFGNVLKDFYMNIDKSKRLDDLTIKLKDLKEIDNVKDAEEMLLERKIEDNFYNSFNSWYESINKEIKLKTMDKSFEFDEVKIFITEMFLVRNLFVHNRGIINDKFKSKTLLYKDLEKDAAFQLNKGFVEECINNTRNLIYYFFYQYCFTKYSNDKILDDFFYDFNTILLNHVESNVDAIGEVYKALSRNDKLNNENKSIALINYYIYKYFNDEFENLIEEFKKVDFSAHDQQFIMAKSILLDDENSYAYIEKYLNESDDDFVFTMFDWPLMKIAKKNNGMVKDLFKNRLNAIIDYEEKVSNHKEEEDYGYEKETSKENDGNKNKINIMSKLNFKKKNK